MFLTLFFFIFNVVSVLWFDLFRYVSEKEQARLLAEEEERQRNAANDQGDNAPERALMEMMGGTLEQEQGLNALEQELVREEWMDELLFEEMSDDQKKYWKILKAGKKFCWRKKKNTAKDWNWN